MSVWPTMTLPISCCTRVYACRNCSARCCIEAGDDMGGWNLPFGDEPNTPRSQTLFGNAWVRNSVSRLGYDSKQSFEQARSQTELGNEGSDETKTMIRRASHDPSSPAAWRA